MSTRLEHTLRVLFAIVVIIILASCEQNDGQSGDTNTSTTSHGLAFHSSNAEINEAFNWAKSKALSYAHDGSDPVGLWYEAALPNREAFCMRDVSHQALGAELLGLSEHNLNMMRKFAQNISVEKDYCSYWEINRHNKPAPVDYEDDFDFWYNLPANFDVVYNTNRLYSWTGNEAYITHPDFLNFYEISMNQYVDHWQLRGSQIPQRDRNLHVTGSRFGNRRGIPTYNEGGRGETLIGIDMTASLIAGYKAYAEILQTKGDSIKADLYYARARNEQQFLQDFWWAKADKGYRSIIYADSTFDYFMVGENQAFLHYLLYFDVLSDPDQKNQIVNNYLTNYAKLIVELKSYLPILFYEHGYSPEASDMIIELCAEGNSRRDYPENSFTVIEHITRGLMGVNANARLEEVSTIPRLGSNNAWAELNDIPLMNRVVSIKHTGTHQTTLIHQSGKPINWRAQLPGTHDVLYINGKQTNCIRDITGGIEYSYCNVVANAGDTIRISLQPGR